MDPEGSLLGRAVQELWAIARRLDELAARKAFLAGTAATCEQKLAVLGAALSSPGRPRHPAALATRSSGPALEQPTTAQVYIGQPVLLYLQDRESHTGAARMAPLDGLAGPEPAGLVGFEPAYATNIAGIGGVLGPRAGMPLRLRAARNRLRMGDDLVKGLRALAAAPSDAPGSFYFFRPVVSPDSEHDDVSHVQAVRNMGLYAAAPLLPLVSAPPVALQRAPARQRQLNVVSVSKAAEEAFELANIERLVADLNADNPARAVDGSSQAGLHRRGPGAAVLRGLAAPAAERRQERAAYDEAQEAALAARLQAAGEARQSRAEASAFEQTRRAVAAMLGDSTPPDLGSVRRALADRHLRLRRSLTQLLGAQVVCVRWCRPDRPAARPVDRVLDTLCKHCVHGLPGFAASSLRLMNRNRRHAAAWEPPAPRSAE